MFEVGIEILFNLPLEKKSFSAFCIIQTLRHFPFDAYREKFFDFFPILGNRPKEIGNRHYSIFSANFF